jgi:hypothetical protein
LGETVWSDSLNTPALELKIKMNNKAKTQYSNSKPYSLPNYCPQMNASPG